MSLFNYKKNKGFTLIELLVVISIISLLSSVVLSSLNTARAKGRDAQRIRDVIEIRNALELYAQDHGGKYPINLDNAGLPTVAFQGTTPGSSLNGGSSSLMQGLVSGGYISKVPQDPKGNTTNCYLFASSVIDDQHPELGAADYKFVVFETMETYTNIQSNKSPFYAMRDLTPATPVRNKSITIYSPGAATW